MAVQQEIRYNDDPNEYINSMIYQRELLLEGYVELLQIQAISGHNEKKLNFVLSRAVVIATELIVELEGCGTRGEKLLDEFKQYRDWKRDLINIKSDEKEMAKIPDLIELILRAYTRLGYTK